MIVMEPGAKGFPRAVQLANQGLLLRIIDFRSARSDEEIELAVTEMLEDRRKRGQEVLYLCLRPHGHWPTSAVALP